MLHLLDPRVPPNLPLPRSMRIERRTALRRNSRAANRRAYSRRSSQGANSAPSRPPHGSSETVSRVKTPKRSTSASIQPADFFACRFASQEPPTPFRPLAAPNSATATAGAHRFFQDRERDAAFRSERIESIVAGDPSTSQAIQRRRTFEGVKTLHRANSSI